MKYFRFIWQPYGTATLSNRLALKLHALGHGCIVTNVSGGPELAIRIGGY